MLKYIQIRDVLKSARRGVRREGSGSYIIRIIIHKVQLLLSRCRMLGFYNVQDFRYKASDTLLILCKLLVLRRFEMAGQALA